MTIKEYGDERAIQAAIDACRYAGLSEEKIRAYIKRRFGVDAFLWMQQEEMTERK